MVWVRISPSLSVNYTKGNVPSPSTTSSSSGGGSSGGSNVEIKYYKSDGTPVWGAKNVTANIPSGATPAKGANITGGGATTTQISGAPIPQTPTKSPSSYPSIQTYQQRPDLFPNQSVKQAVMGGTTPSNSTQNGTQGNLKPHQYPTITSEKGGYRGEYNPAEYEIAQAKKNRNAINPYEAAALRIQEDNRKRLYNQPKVQTNASNPFSIIGETGQFLALKAESGFSIAAIGTAVALSNIPKAVKSFGYSVTHPRQSAQELWTHIETDPASAAFEGLTYYGIGKVGGKVAGDIYEASPIKPEIELIGGSFSKEGVINIKKPVGIAVGIQTRNLKTGSITPRGYTSTLKKAPAISEEWQPSTAIGGEFFIKNVKKLITEPSSTLIEGRTVTPKFQQDFAVNLIKGQREVGNIKSPFTTETLLKGGTSRLSPEGTKALLDFANDIRAAKIKGNVLFGSAATKDQLLPIAQRPINDLDFFINTASEAELTIFTKGAAKAVKAAGKDVIRIPKESPFHIESFKGGKWDKAAEFKGIGIGEGDVVPSRAYGYNLAFDRETIDIGGVKVAGITAESKRKLAASVAIRPAEGSSNSLGVTHTGRFKDPLDSFRIMRTQAAGAQLKGFKTPAATKALDFANTKGIKYMEGKGTLSYDFTPPTKGGGFSSAFSPVSPLPYNNEGFATLKINTPEGYFIDTIDTIKPITIPKDKPSPRSPPSPVSGPSFKLPSFNIPSSKGSGYKSPYVSPSAYSPYKSPSPYKPSPSPPSPSPSPSPPSPSPKSPPSPSPYNYKSPYSGYSPSPSPYSYVPPPPPTYLLSPSLPSGGGGGFNFFRPRPIKQPKGYTPTAFSAIGKIRGTPTRGGSMSGLGLRPIPLKGLKMPKIRWKF